jgi:hypothetical protein
MAGRIWPKDTFSERRDWRQATVTWPIKQTSTCHSSKQHTSIDHASNNCQPKAFAQTFCCLCSLAKESRSWFTYYIWPSISETWAAARSFNSEYCQVTSTCVTAYSSSSRPIVACQTHTDTSSISTTISTQAIATNHSVDTGTSSSTRPYIPLLPIHSIRCTQSPCRRTRSAIIIAGNPRTAAIRKRHYQRSCRGKKSTGNSSRTRVPGMVG